MNEHEIKTNIGEFLQLIKSAESSVNCVLGVEDDPEIKAQLFLLQSSLYMAETHYWKFKWLRKEKEKNELCKDS